MKRVNVWEEKVIIPTYEIGSPEKNPVFLENRVYQGSSGVVYPNPVIESIADEKIEKEWQAVFLENEYLKIMLLPQLGGRVQMAYDKTKERHFIYYNEVIKPALVGLTGPWISGGIEFNWPQHHRPTTYEAVEYDIIENPDGSKTVWCNEIDRMYRTKGMAGFTIYPDKSFLEINVKLYNRTSLPQTFLWWANPALRVNDHYQSIFPPDVHAVFDHGKRDVSAFPIAKGTYYKVDYSKGVDISRYKNIPVPTSYMAVNSKYDFVGGYEHDTQGGIVHVANHHVSPGKKQWTWGNGEFGYAWDRNLTDENGPYVELMCGVYTDNQPDFSWLMPYEEKSFSQYFMPYRDLGQIKNATQNAMVNLEVNQESISIKIYTTAIYKNASIELFHKDVSILKEDQHFSPHDSYSIKLENDKGYQLENCYFVLKTEDGKVLVDWQAEPPEFKEIPAAATAAKLPGEIESIEQLYLNGLHLEQYRHATYRPEDYYQEALKREPANAMCNKAMGMLLMRNGHFKEATQYLQKAVNTLLTRNPNPIDGEAHFYLGQSLQYQGMYEAAYDAYYKATWNAYCMDTAYFHLAQLTVFREDWKEALDLVNRSLDRNQNHHKARHLKVFLLRKLQRTEEAVTFASHSLHLDGFNHGIQFELSQLGQANKENVWYSKMNNIHSFIEISQDYAAFGAFEEAVQILENGIAQFPNRPYAITFYFLAYYKLHLGTASSFDWEKAATAIPDFCFPNQLEEAIVLEAAIKENPSDSFALYYLGNFYYHHRNFLKAIELWERSTDLNQDFPTVWRNLSLAYFNKNQAPQKALDCIHKAFELDDSDARVFMEYDQLLKKLNTPTEQRLLLFEKYEHLVEQRDDLYVEYVALLNLHEQYDKAYQQIMARQFHPWEGGEGKVTGQYEMTTKALATQLLDKGEVEKSMNWLRKAQDYPHSLGEGKLHGKQENDIYYYLGRAYQQLGDIQKANHLFEQGATGDLKPAVPWFYNDQQPDTIFYKGLSLLALHRHQEAQAVFNSLIDFANAHLNDKIRMDYFAVSYPEIQVWDMDFQQKNKIHCLYIRGLGYLGKNEVEKAKQDFLDVLTLENTHLGAKLHSQQFVNRLIKT